MKRATEDNKPKGELEPLGLQDEPARADAVTASAETTGNTIDVGYYGSE